MSILKVSQMGHPVLRRAAQPVDPDQIQTDAFQRLVADMHQTMAAYQGVGLAAPQVHYSIRMLLYLAEAEDSEEGPETFTLINPVIDPIGEEMASGWEGCLSIPDIRGLVPRNTHIRVTALDEEGEEISFEAQDFEARVIQHEVDHLDGILYFDRMEDLTTLSFMTEYEMFWAPDGDDDADDDSDA
jgi:peptide deformylase